MNKFIVIIAGLICYGCAFNSKVSTASGDESLRKLYHVLAARESFPMPKVLTDYAIDDAMRLGVVMPLVWEDESTRHTQYFFLCGKLEREMKKLSIRKQIKVLETLEQDWGRTHWSKQYATRFGLPIGPNAKSSTYLVLNEIKDQRKEQGKWNP